MKIIILDYSTSEVHVFDYDRNMFESGEQYIEMLNEDGNYHFKKSEISFMVVENLSINIH